jgi:N-methylhydantoinase A/acetophenone carboxylase
VGVLYGETDVISADMGGTSFDIGLVSDGRVNVGLRPEIEGYRTNVPMNEVEALGAGGGSIAGMRDGRLFVGPRSAGAMPGPACFGLGGSDPTVTDANLVLGRIDPGNFLGGARKLDVEKARAAIRTVLAEPLGISVEAAALAVIAQVEQDVGAAVRGLKSAARSGDPLLNVYGGAGPLHACKVAETAGLRRIAITPFSAVFSAFSSSLMDVGHGYMRAVGLSEGDPQLLQKVGALVAEMKEAGLRDMRGEGFDLARLSWRLDAIMCRPDGSEARCSADVSDPVEPTALRTLHDVIVTEVPDAVKFASIGLFVSAPVAHFRFEEKPMSGDDIATARTGRREIVTLADAPPVAAPVFDLERMQPGHSLSGPALLESSKTTVWVAPGWEAGIDRYANLMLTRA